MTAGAPKGNKNAARGTEFRDALRKVLRNYEDDKIARGKALEGVANRLLLNALEGDLGSIQEIANRTDGKVKQQTEISTGPDSGPVALTLVVQGMGSNAAADPSGS